MKGAVERQTAIDLNEDVALGLPSPIVESQDMGACFAHACYRSIVSQVGRQFLVSLQGSNSALDH